MTLTKNEHGYYEVRLKGEDGKVRSRSTHRKNLQDAKELVREAKLAELELASQMGVLSQDVVSVLMTGKRMTVEAAIQPWAEAMQAKHRSPRSIANATTWVNAWAASVRCQKRLLASLTQADMDAWINSKHGIKLSTRKVMLSALRSFCRFCADNGWLMGNPANLVDVDMSILRHEQKEPKRRTCFTEDEVQALIQATGRGMPLEDYFWHSAIVIGRYTGLRLGDICCLEWDCLELNPGMITVWTQKRDRRVSLPLEPAILAETVDALEWTDQVYVFPEQREIALTPDRRALLSVQFGRLAERCGISGKSFHCLRHTYCTDCFLRGIPVEHIAVSVGHANTQTTEGYIEQAERLEAR